MSEMLIYSFGVLCLAVLIVGWMLRYFLGRVEGAADRAAQSHVYAILERERAERVLDECRKVLSQCQIAAGAAYESAATVEEFIESIEIVDETEEDEDEYDTGSGY